MAAAANEGSGAGEKKISVCVVDVMNQQQQRHGSINNQANAHGKPCCVAHGINIARNISRGSDKTSASDDNQQTWR